MEKDLDRPIAYLICGKVGSGKTTYATRLATERQAPIFSIDAWMVTLFGADTPSSGAGGPIDFAWYAERVDRCEAMIWELCKQQIAQHRNVVLDLGFSVWLDGRGSSSGQPRQVPRCSFISWRSISPPVANAWPQEIGFARERSRLL